MGPVTATIPIDVPRERAFDFLADLANRPAFMRPFVADYRLQRLESSGVGAAARFRFADTGVWAETVIEELEPPYRLFERGRGGRLDRVPMFTVWEVTDAGAGGCEVSVAFWTEPAGPIDRLRDLRPRLRRSHRRGWRDSLQRLRDLLEGGEAPQRVAVAGGDRVPGSG